MRSGNAMRWVLFILGWLLLLQVALHVGIALYSGGGVEAAGAALDRDLVRLTAGLCAITIARGKGTGPAKSEPE